MNNRKRFWIDVVFIIFAVLFFIAIGVGKCTEAHEGTEADGHYVSKQCGRVPAQPEILPVTGETMNVISDHNFNVRVWLECAKEKAIHRSDFDLIDAVETEHTSWVLKGMEKTAESYPATRGLNSIR